MPLKTPLFWYQQPTLLAHLLTPLAWIYQLGHRLNQSCKPQPYKSSITVICIGNAIAGGSGKTPTAIALVKMIQENKIAKTPLFLTRGYGGTITTPTIVNPKKHTSHDVGDEALLLAAHATTIISANRADGAKLAEKQDADLIIMDDGLQNNTLHKDLSFLVVDRAVDFGNGKTIPAGPLREPLRKTLPKAQAIICIGPAFHSDKPVFAATITSENNLDANKKYIAFAGLGRPEKFKNTLIDLGINLVGWYPFADHHPYNDDEISLLQEQAKAHDATLVTTEKDFIRLSLKQSNNIKTLPISLNFEQPKNLTHYLNEFLNIKK